MSTSVTTEKPVRLSYTNLLEPYAQNEKDEPKFSTSILIPKSDTDTIEAIKAAVKEAVAEGKAKKWKGRIPKDLHNPLRDGDTKEDKDGNPDLLYADHWFLNAKGPRGGAERPILLDKDSEETDSASDIYSGVIARVSLQFYPYDTSGNQGIAAGVTAVLSTGTGEPLGNVVTADSARDKFGVKPSSGASKAKGEFASGSAAKATESEAPDDADDDDPWAKD